MNLDAITTGAFQEICYIVWGKAKRALVLDPGQDAPLIFQALEKHGLEVEAYICTHGHADHINALAEVHAKHPAPVAMHSGDWSWAFGDMNQIEPHYPVPRRPDVEDALRLESAKDWTFSDLKFQCLETPGHTPGSCCILFPEGRIMIAGDTLFKGSCGRTDLPGGSPRQLKDSLNKLKQLPDEVRVFPGHGPDTTVGIERATNFFMH
ncbi:MBL fold metallo-hydrolase [Pontiella sulfatireligans]|uniref:Hydroxyacylglutathione hydrolase GloC n=1 Tax=Pontiella sulfatireligans TaxID=2750658 RepID=A0A6C2UW29_9BACT|nr:MBL fold metallo-hydrolase [Pontiella sulfatireligans]VGO23317.1 Hydroxyacylglutathione hydrolase GloC [Pontiella sulfatireligans]